MADDGAVVDDEKTSRLIVKGLGPSVTDTKLRSHFSAYGDITQCYVKTKDQGKRSRGFGFVGFRDTSAASTARAALDRTYLGACKLSVEFAKSRKHQEQHQRPRTEQQQPQSQGAKKRKQQEQQEQQQRARDTEGSGAADKKGGGGGKGKVAELKGDYMSVMTKRSASSAWANDEAAVEGGGGRKKTATATGDDGEDSSGSGSDDGEGEGGEDGDADGEEGGVSRGKAFDSTLSDMDYLRSKAKASSSDDGVPPKDKSKKRQRRSDDGGAGGEDGEAGAKSAEAEAEAGAGAEEEEEDPFESGRLICKNLPFAVDEGDLQQLFGEFGTVSNIRLPLARGSGDNDEGGGNGEGGVRRQRGFAFVQYMLPDDAAKACAALDQHVFQGRVLIVQPAEPLRSSSSSSSSSGGGDPVNLDPKLGGQYKQLKEIQRRLKSEDSAGWNASFVRSDAVVDDVASRLGVSKQDFLDRSLGGSSSSSSSSSVVSASMAVRMALGETRLLAENRDFFLREGVDLNTPSSSSSSSSESSKSSSSTKRSDVMVMVKNLPASADLTELTSLFSKYGALARALLAPSKTVLLVEFVEPGAAKKAFRGLAYRRYQNQPLYLEWAPQSSGSHRSTTTTSATAQDRDEDDEPAVGEDSLMNYPELADGGRAAKRAKKKAAAADATPQEAQKAKKQQKPPTKILVKNVPFAASAGEVRELFSSFGQLKALRMPKKFNGSHRGYAFVEYARAHEAEDAMARLAATHLYGRHLVCTWAAAEEGDDGQ